MTVNMKSPTLLEACCAPSDAAVLSESAALGIAEVLSVLADPVRLRILSTLVAEGEVCSCHLEEPLAKSQPTISHHLNRLAEAGLVNAERRGRWTYWSLRPEHFATFRDFFGSWANGANS